MGTQRISSGATAERELRERALADAADLFATHGHAAIALVSDRLIDQSRSPTERRCDRLTLLAVERIERENRQSGVSTALVVWKPPVFSLDLIVALFGIKRGRKRRR